MAVFMCKSCGGDLDVESHSKVVSCDYCGVKQTIPSADDEKKVNLFNRANKMRMLCEFDKANVLYQNIVSEFPNEAEAFWGLCLCKYGVEYVDDPRTKSKVPTLHRASTKSILSDDDFKTAIIKSDVIAKDQYQNEAAEIDRLNNEINEIAQKEKPYDVFICYKETDENGQRTKDSVRAQEIYDVLSNKGYKVFFARITLEDKLGEKYEPYIFSALSSAKVMLAIGTKSEYFNAVWVRNEWSRYLDIMERDSSKRLFPCYCDIDAYDLPIEFKNLQAQDMSKVGFEQDLARNIEKIIPLKKASTVASTSNSRVGIEDLVSNAQKMLSYKNYPAADKLYTKITENYPEDHRGWWGKILCLTETLSKSYSDSDSFEMCYNILQQTADKKALSEYKMQLFAFFKNVISAEHASTDIFTYNKAIDQAQLNVQHHKNNILQAERKTEAFIKACEEEIAELRAQYNIAQNQVHTYAECERMRVKGRRGILLVAISGIICVLLTIVFAMNNIMNIFSSKDSSSFVGMYIPIVVFIGCAIAGIGSKNKAIKTLRRTGINIADYGVNHIAALKNQRLINYLANCKNAALADSKRISNQINHTQKELDKNRAHANSNENVKLHNRELADYLKCLDIIKEALAISKEKHIQYKCCLICRRFEINAPDVDKSLYTVFNKADYAVKVINGKEIYSDEIMNSYNDNSAAQSDTYTHTAQKATTQINLPPHEVKRDITSLDYMLSLINETETQTQPVAKTNAQSQEQNSNMFNADDILALFLDKTKSSTHPEPQSQSQGSYCAMCGNFIGAGGAFCSACGAKVDEIQQ